MSPEQKKDAKSSSENVVVTIGSVEDETVESLSVGDLRARERLEEQAIRSMDERQRPNAGQRRKRKAFRLLMTFSISGVLIVASALIFLNASRSREREPAIGQVITNKTEETPVILYPECFRTATNAVTGEMEKMLPIITRACEGDAESQFLLGQYFAIGDNVSQNDKEALKWFRRAAEQGHTEGNLCAGVAYYYGEGTNENWAAAAELWLKAAEEGSRLAQYNIGLCYLDGMGVETNLMEAVKWLRKSGAQGVVEARFELAVCLLNATGVEQDTVEAVRLLEELASQGHSRAMYNLGVCHFEGRGVERSMEKAVAWLKKAATLDNKESGALLESIEIARQTELVKHAREIFRRKDNPRFKDDEKLTRLANAIAWFNLHYPTLSECKELLEVCDDLAGSDYPESIRRAIEGSRYLLENERDMMNKGYRRYGRRWVRG